MAIERITDRLVRGLPLPEDGKNQRIVRDDLITGFAVRKTATGFTTFIFNYVCAGVERRLAIGSPPAWSVAAAREEAKRLRRQVDRGSDPLEERRRATREPTLRDLWTVYERDVLPRKAPKTRDNEKSIWERLVLPSLGSKRLSHIHSGDIERLRDKISSTTPVQANRALASLQHAFSRAIRWKLADHNPVKGVERNREHFRERFLSNDELRRLLAALDARAETPSTLLIRFLLLTGARSGEAFKATWDQFDLEHGIWCKPSAHTKQRRPHRTPLSPEALIVLAKALGHRRGDLVFPGRGGKPLSSVKKVFHSLCGEAELNDLRVHDLRHSFASFLVSEGISLPKIGRLLGHTQVTTTNRYAHLEDISLRSATDIVSRKVASSGQQGEDQRSSRDS